MRAVVIAVVLGLLVGWGWPVAAQAVVRIYGTQSDGTITQILIDSTGKLSVTGS